MLPELSPTLLRRQLTSLFPADLIEDIARERDAVQCHRKIDITMLVWSLILGFAVDGETRSITAFQLPDSDQQEGLSLQRPIYAATPRSSERSPRARATEAGSERIG